MNSLIVVRIFKKKRERISLNNVLVFHRFFGLRIIILISETGLVYNDII